MTKSDTTQTHPSELSNAELSAELRGIASAYGYSSSQRLQDLLKEEERRDG